MIELAVIVPTFNERENVRLLLAQLETALRGLAYEVIFVDDDSPDQTAQLIREIAVDDPRVRMLHRIRRRGLSSACLEGMMATAAPYIAVMDADLQHDEKLLPVMLAAVRDQHLDLAVASRYTEGGSVGDFSTNRRRISSFAGTLSAAISRCELHDPMSGFFLLDARFLREVVHRVSGLGFKILLDIVASSNRPVRLIEVPYRFRNRLHGESKLDVLVAIEYLQLLLDKTVGDYFPPKYILFSLVGSVGALLYMALFWVLLKGAQLPFATVIAIATIATMTVNFFLNNNVTYRERRLRGTRLLTGLFWFYAACSVGAVITVRAANLAANAGAPWYVGGLFGLTISSVWNYAVTRLLTWRYQRRRDKLA